MLSFWGPSQDNYTPKLLNNTQQHSTTSSRVERAIRHAIGVAWNRGNMDMLNRIFGSTVKAEQSRPTNAEFMAMIADKIRMDRKAS